MRKIAWPAKMADMTAPSRVSQSLPKVMDFRVEEERRGTNRLVVNY